MSQRTNYPASVTTLVASGNQALATANGIYDGAADSGVANGQLGVISWDDSATHIAKGDFFSATNDVAGTGPNTKADIRKIKIVQGTGNSADYSGLNANSIAHSAPSFIASKVITDKDEINFVGTAATVGRNSAFLVGADVAGTTSINPLDDSVYRLSVGFHSTRRDKVFGTRSTDAAHLTTATPSTFSSIGLTTKADKVDWIIQRLVFEGALRSKAVNLSETGYTGTKPFIALAIDLDGGGTGTAISAVAAGTPFNFVTKNGTTYSYTPNAAFVASLTEAVANTSLLTTSEIGVVDLSTTQAHDAILIVALDEGINGVVTDHETRQKVRLRVSMNEVMYQDSNITYLAEASRYIDPQGLGRHLQLEYIDRAKKQVYTQQWFGMSNSFLQAPDYINTSGTYNVFDIYTNEDKLMPEGRVEKIPHVTKILVPATSAGVGEATTVTSLNAILTPWLNSVGFETKLTDAAGTNLFV